MIARIDADQVENILLRIGLEIETEAKRNCPVDTGRLRASINTQAHPKGVIVGTNVKYGKYVEFGTEKMRPQPYLRPALDTVGRKYGNIKNIR